MSVHEPTGVVMFNRDASTSRVLVGVAIALFAVMFLVMWGPLYLSGSEGGLLLWPLSLLALPVVGGLSVAGVVYGARGYSAALAAGGGGRRTSLFGIVGGSVLATLALPVLWLGNAPLVVFGG